MRKHNDFSGVGASDMEIYSLNEAHQAHLTWENITISPMSAPKGGEGINKEKR